MYYVYRYLKNRIIKYIGITNCLETRYEAHKRDKWYSKSLIYQFIEVNNKYIAKLFETFLINRDNPINNIAENNNYDVNAIKFDIEENWMDFKSVDLPIYKMNCLNNR